MQKDAASEAALAAEKRKTLPTRLVEIGKLEVQVQNAIEATCYGRLIDEALTLPEPEDREQQNAFALRRS